jgi:hypothetical protein
MLREVVDHSNDSFIGDRPACEAPDNWPPSWYYQKCPNCGKFGKSVEVVSMGSGYDEWEQLWNYECKCGEKY